MNKNNLISRYVGMYGKDIEIYVYMCEENTEIEKDCKEAFRDWAVMPQGELLHQAGRDACREYMRSKTGGKEDVYTMKDMKDKFEDIEEYRIRKNITPEQVELTRQKRQSDRDMANVFCMVTSPDVDVVRFAVTKRTTKHVVDVHSVYYGPDTIVAYVDTKTEGCTAYDMRDRMGELCVAHNNIWSLYDKSFWDDYIRCVVGMGEYKICGEKKYDARKTRMCEDGNMSWVIFERNVA